MILAAIGVGSNLEEPALQVRRAFDEMVDLPQTRLVTRSPLYRSRAIGPDGLVVPQPDFCNAAVLLETRLMPRELLQALQVLETSHGRKPQTRWAARSLDLDLLVYGDQTLDESDIKVPHPRMTMRNFVMYPLCDIAPELTIPGFGQVRQLTMSLESKGLLPWQD